MKKINLIARIGLFALVLGLGTMAAMAAGETKGVALADLSGAPVQVMTAASGGDVLYASLAGGPQPAGIYRSDDNGHTWQLVSSGPGVAAIRALPGIVRAESAGCAAQRCRQAVRWLAPVLVRLDNVTTHPGVLQYTRV